MVMVMVIGLLVLFGLCMGSFVEAVSWRLHEQDSHKKLTAKQRRELSIMRGRSMCAHCRHQLAWYDLVPLLSWLSLGGKCRYCRKPIGRQAIALEVMTASLFVLSWQFWPLIIMRAPGVSWLVFALWLAVVVHFVLLAIYDIRWMLLPNKVVASLTVTSVVLWVAREYFLRFELLSLVNVAASVAILAGLFWLLYQISDGKWIGGGDVKLGVPLGIIVAEPVHAGLVLFIASLLGSIVGVAVAARKRSRRAQVPFGPFLIVATFIVLLFGDWLIDWYLRVVLA